MPFDPVRLVPVTADNWRALCDLTVTKAQSEHVAPVSHYLNLCAYGGVWRPLALERSDSVVGFVMWATDDDGSRWIGGLVVDRRHQRQGVARAAVTALVEQGRQDGCPNVALSYAPANVQARDLYASLGFVPTGEVETDGSEIVARLVLTS